MKKNRRISYRLCDQQYAYLMKLHGQLKKKTGCGNSAICRVFVKTLMEDKVFRDEFMNHLVKFAQKYHPC